MIASFLKAKHGLTLRLVLAGLFLLAGQAGFIYGKTVKTSYKKFSIFTFEGTDYLCEPYEVKPDDWLYKIFRQKGEISEKDFPFFLKIFKAMNPDIDNIDAISPKSNILIPLKKVTRSDYKQDATGAVEVPVVEFSTTPEAPDEPVIEFTEHTMEPGDTLSELMDKRFLEKGGKLSEEGEKLFLQLNPRIKDIHLIHAGARIKIPKPPVSFEFAQDSPLGQKALFPPGGPGKSSKPKETAISPAIQAYRLQQLKRYADLIHGTLINQGTMTFPGKEALPDATLDLAHTPVIERGAEDKILIFPGGTPIDPLVLKNIKAYWHHLRTMEIDRAIHESHHIEAEKKAKGPIQVDHFLTAFFKGLGLDFTPNEKIDFMVGSLEMSAELGRVDLPDKPDLLINSGKLFGLALNALAEKGFDVLLISPQMSETEICRLLFSRLGYTTWENPPFTFKGVVKTIPGIYAMGQTKKIFVSWKPLDPRATDFLSQEAVTLIQVNASPGSLP